MQLLNNQIVLETQSSDWEGKLSPFLSLYNYLVILQTQPVFGRCPQALCRPWAPPQKNTCPSVSFVGFTQEKKKKKTSPFCLTKVGWITTNCWKIIQQSKYVSTTHEITRTLIFAAIYSLKSNEVSPQRVLAGSSDIVMINSSLPTQSLYSLGRSLI